MAIRKVVEPKVQKDHAKTSIPPATPRAAFIGVDALFKDGTLSQNEIKGLEDHLKDASPELKKEMAALLQGHLEARQKSGHPIAISEAGLSKLTGLLGLDLKDLFFRRQLKSEVVTHDVTQGLAKETKTTADEHDAAKHKAASDTRLHNQQAILDGKNGVEGRPIGGSKGAAYDAAGVLVEHFEKQLDDKLPPEAKAAKDVLREPLVKIGKAVVTNPETMKKVGDVASTIGTPGFKEALGTACTSMGKDIVDATNMCAVNVDAVNGVVNFTQNAVGKLGTLAKGNVALEKVVAEHGGKLATGVAKLGSKLTQGAEVAGAAGVVKTGAQVASVATAAAEGAQVATAGAKVAGQSVPIVGQALGVITTGLAATELIGTCRHKPRDWKRVFSSAANVIGQAVGIFIPFVGAATTAGKLAADAAMNAHDKKLGKDPHKTLGLGDVAPHVSSATSLITPFLEGAGYGDAAKKIKGYNAQLGTLAEKNLTSTDLASMQPAEREALEQTLAACHNEMQQVAEEAKGTPHEAASLLMGQAFQQIMAVWRKSKNVGNAEDPEAEKKRLAGEALEAAGKASAAQALDH